MKRFIPVIFFLVMLLASCSSDMKNSVIENPDRNYDGYDFIVLMRDFAADDPWLVYEIGAEYQNGEILNDSIVQRDREVEEKWNITLTKLIHSNPASYAYNNIMAETHAFDVMYSSLFDCSRIAQSGLAYNLNDMIYMDMSDPWWDQSAVRDLSIGDSLYFVTGDFSYKNYNASWIYMFNKNIVNSYSLDDPYELVKSGDWTIDKFGEMIQTVSYDVDNRYGLITESANTLGMFIGAGNSVISKDSDNYPVITLSTKRGVTSAEKILKYLNNNTAVINVNDPFFTQYSDNVWQGVVETFTNDRGLFYSTVMYTVNKLRGMNSDFGILPMPKLDETQETHYTWVSPWIASGLVVPASLPDPERTGRILDSIASKSMEIVRPAYYDVTIDYKFARDIESTEMMDIILDNRVYDLGMIYDWGGIGSLLSVMNVESETTFTSRYASIIENAKIDLTNTVNDYRRF